MALKEIFAQFRIGADDSGLRKLDAGVSGLSGKLKSLGAALAGGAIVSGLRSLVNQTAEAGAEINDSALRLGFGTQELQTWRYAAKLAGVSAEGLEGAFQKLNLAADNASQGAKPQVSAFKALGVAFKDADGRIRPTAELLPEIADGLARVGDPAKQSGLAVDLLGRSGTKLLPLLKEGSAGLEKYRKELEELGGVMSSDLIAQSDEYGDNIDRMDFALAGLRNTLVLNVLPALTNLALQSAKAVAGISKLVEKTNLLKVAGAALATAAAGWAVKLAVANAGTLLLAGGIALAVIALEDLYTLFTGGKSVVGDFLDEMRPLGLDAQEWVAGLTGVWRQFVDVLETAWAIGKDVVGLFGGNSPSATKAKKEEIAKREKDEAAARANAPQLREAAQKKAVAAGDVAAFQEAGGSFDDFKKQRLNAVKSGAVQATEKDRATFGKEIAPAAAVQSKSGGSGGGKTVNMGATTLNIQVPAGTSREMANEIAKIAGNEIDKRQRAAHAALRESSI